MRTLFALLEKLAVNSCDLHDYEAWQKASADLPSLGCSWLWIGVRSRTRYVQQHRKTTLVHTLQTTTTNEEVCNLA